MGFLLKRITLKNIFLILYNQVEPEELMGREKGMGDKDETLKNEVLIGFLKKRV